MQENNKTKNKAKCSGESDWDKTGPVELWFDWWVSVCLKWTSLYEESSEGKSVYTEGRKNPAVIHGVAFWCPHVKVTKVIWARKKRA